MQFHRSTLLTNRHVHRGFVIALDVLLTIGSRSKIHLTSPLEPTPQLFTLWLCRLCLPVLTPRHRLRVAHVPRLDVPGRCPSTGSRPGHVRTRRRHPIRRFVQQRPVGQKSWRGDAMALCFGSDAMLKRTLTELVDGSIYGSG